MPTKLPHDEIDLSLFCHIQNDAFIQGGFQIEGQVFKRTISYLNGYFESLEELKSALIPLKKSMQELVDITTQMNTVRDQRDLTALSLSIATQITALKENESLSMPGGWLTLWGGHAMAYQFKRTAKGLEFYIHNAGAGLKYHEHKSERNRELFYPVKAYKITLSVDEAINIEKLSDFLGDLIRAQMPLLRNKKDKLFDAEKLYQEVFDPGLSFLDAELFSVADQAKHAFTAGQLSGTCAQRVLHQMIKENLSNEDEYKQFIYGFKRHALDDFISLLTKNGRIKEKLIQEQLQHAMNTMTRILGSSKLFSEDFIEAELKEFKAYRTLLESTLKEKIATPSTELSITSPKTSFQLIPLPDPYLSTREEPLVSESIQSNTISPITGGKKLLQQIDLLLSECQQLQAKNQPVGIIEGLESIFAKFPLCADNLITPEVMEFYKEIKGENKLDFVKKLTLLHSLYLEACTALSSKEVVVPRMFATALNVSCLLAQVHRPDRLLRYVISEFLQQFSNNPYLATNNPLLDKRLVFIASLYPEDYFTSAERDPKELRICEYELAGYYMNIINSEPSLRNILEEQYTPPNAPDLAKELKKLRVEALYCFLEKYTKFKLDTKPNVFTQEFMPLVKKFELQEEIEKCAVLARKNFKKKQPVDDLNQGILFFFKKNGEIYSKAVFLCRKSSLNEYLLDHKYSLKNKVIELALTDFFKDENQLQLSLAHYTRTPTGHIYKQDISNREFFHLRSSPLHQIRQTLDYFTLHLNKLDDPEIQIYIEANLFEPGLLLTELDKNPEILDQLNHFNNLGLNYFANEGLLSLPSLFFIRLAYLVNDYVLQYKPALGKDDLDKFQTRISSLIESNQENDVSIQLALHQYQFFSALSALKSKSERITDSERKAILEQALPSYFFIKSKGESILTVDSATKFDWKCAEYQFKQFLLSCKSEQIHTVLKSILENFGLGTCVNGPKKIRSLAKITMMHHGCSTVYTIDVQQGLIFKEGGIFSTSIPLDILHHPILPYLNIKSMQPCYRAANELSFEIGNPPELRFIRNFPYGPYKIQKKWEIAHESKWYDLHDLSKEHRNAAGINSEIIALPFPEILKQRTHKVWVECSQPRSILLTEYKIPIYHGISSGSDTWIAKQLDASGKENGFILCIEETEIHRHFSHFEYKEFFTVCKHDSAGTFQIKFDRYGLILIAKQEAGHWVFHKADNPSEILVSNSNTVIPGAAGLIFEDKLTHSQTCYMPVQQFLSTEEQSSTSIFHRLEQDISAKIPKHVLKEIQAQPEAKEIPLLWEFSNSERLVLFQLDKKGQPRADNTSEALYLCYSYLACHQPKKAWYVLEECSKRFGGIKGTDEELSLLKWILESLPYSMDDKDKKAAISSPAYVACQLKALALLTSVITPESPISKASKRAFNVSTPEGVYQKKCSEDINLLFNCHFNKILYSLYTRYQNMQRHITPPFTLSDDEKRSLLNYYQFDDKDKPLGALGYEVQLLELKLLKKEYDALISIQKASVEMPLAYKKRLLEIETLLKTNRAIYATHTEIESLPIDLSLKIDNKELLGIAENPSSWNDAATSSELENALKLLKPDISENILLSQFRCYYQLILSDSAANKAHQKKLQDFCRQYLMAQRHITLKSTTAFFINVLYRISENRKEFIRRKSIKNSNAFFDILLIAMNLTAPEIRIYQTRHTTSKVLAQSSDIWDSLIKEDPIPSPITATETCSDLQEFDLNHLIQCAFDDHSNPSKNEFLALIKKYQQNAAILGAPDEMPPSIDTKQMVLSPAEKTAGITQYDALNAMRNIAGLILETESNINKLETHSQAFIADIEKKRQTLQERILSLANSGPSDETPKKKRTLELEGQVRDPLTIEGLLTLYLQADKTLYTLETGLTEEQITILHTELSHFVALSTRQQALQRFCNQIKTIRTDKTPSKLQHVAHELLAQDLINYQRDTALAILQYQDNILLRPQQIDALQRLLQPHASDKHAFNEEIIKLIMGGGKSKVVLPALAQKKAKGTNLVVIEVPQALFGTNFTDLYQTSARLFNQKAVSFTFNRMTSCSEKNLQFLYSKLIDVIVRKDYLVTTGESIQSLELKYLELLMQKPSDKKQQSEWKAQIQVLDKLVSLFRTRADVIIDEVHQGLLQKKKLNYTLSKGLAIPGHIIQSSLELYAFLDQLEIQTPLGEQFAGKMFSSLLENNQLITTEAQWEAVFNHLRKNLGTHASSPLVTLGLDFSPENRLELEEYLSGKSEKIPDFIQQAAPKIKDIFALYKEQVSRLLPFTLKRKINADYGTSQKPEENGLAIPYIANNEPSKHSHFGNYLESINFSIQVLLIQGFSPNQLKVYLKRLQVQAKQELLLGRAKTLNATPTAKRLKQLAPELQVTLSELHLENDTQFSAIFEVLSRNKYLIYDLLKLDLLPQIHIEPEFLHSGAHAHMKLYRSCQGLTGTPSNSTTFYQGLHYQKEKAAATDGFILKILQEKQTSIRSVDQSSITTLLNGLFNKKEAPEKIRAIIDISAAFKGISNTNVALKLREYIEIHTEQFTEPKPLKYVLYFNEENLLCALSLTKDSQPLVIGSTDPEIINTKLGCLPEERFSYYDQAHTVGIDLKQAGSAKALVMVDHETQAQNFFQGCLRMRGLQDEQTVELIIPSSMPLPTFDDLIANMVRNEEQQLKQDNFTAALAKMTNLVRTDLIERLLALDHEDIDTKYKYAQEFKPYLVERSPVNFFETYGSTTSIEKTEILLRTHAQKLLTDWSKILKAVDEEATNITNLPKDLEQVIQVALPLCHETYSSALQQTQGNEVELEKQTELELNRENELQTTALNQYLIPAPYREHYDFDDQDKPIPLKRRTLNYLNAQATHVKSLSQICELSNSTLTLKFGEIYAGPNYYQTYAGQKTFLDPYLKPVHALVFKINNIGLLQCFILSQRELHDLAPLIDKEPSGSIWISNTQHTVLAGTAPEHIKEDIEYRRLIEQVAFFNGELQSLFNRPKELCWLADETEEKLLFFEQNILPYRETTGQDLLNLRQLLLSKQFKDEVEEAEEKIKQEQKVQLENESEVTHYNFYLNCLIGIGVVAGGALLVLGIILLNPIIMGVGTGVLAASLGSSRYKYKGGFFSNTQALPSDIEHRKDSGDTLIP